MKLSPEEITIRMLAVDAENMIADIELEIFEHNFKDWVVDKAKFAETLETMS